LRSYLDFLKRNFEPVFFGFLLTFFSSFGQTFLISLFVPFILADLAFSNSVFGGYYAMATIISSLIMLRVGHVIDDRPVRPFTIKTTILLTTACVLLALAWHPAVLFVALVGLRLGGQGLLSHISLSTMSRYFSKDRGKALSISSLGYSVGEMIFPILIAAIIGAFGWRAGAMATAVMALLLLAIMPLFRVERLDYVPGKGRIGKVSPIPSRVSNMDAAARLEGVSAKEIPGSVNDQSAEQFAGKAEMLEGKAEMLEGKAEMLAGKAEMLVTESESTSGETEKSVGKRAFYWQMLKESRFYILVMPSFLLSFTITGFFFYQYLIAESRGWPITTYTYLFAGYGLIRLISGLYGGILTDSYRTTTLFVVHLIPMALGILALALVPGILSGALFLFGVGVTTGAGMVIKNAIVAEIYGVTRIGQVRSLFMMFMVFSTALAPLLFGILLDRGVTFEQIALGSVVSLVIVTLHTVRIYGLKPS